MLARIPKGTPRELVLTTTLAPCLQCPAAIRMAPVALVRYAGADRLWEGCHDFSPLSARDAGRPEVAREGPLPDPLGPFATLISRLWPDSERVRGELRALGERDLLDLVEELRASGRLERLRALEVREAFLELAPRLPALGAAGGG